MTTTSVERSGVGPVLSVIEQRFPGSPDATGRPDGACVRLPAAQLSGVLALLRRHPDLDFDQLVALVGTDLSGLAGSGSLELTYLLRSTGRGHRAQVCVDIGDAAAPLPSAADHWPGSVWLEREAHEMLGLPFSGAGTGERLLTPTWFGAYPLRRDYPVGGRGERAVAAGEEPGAEPRPGALQLVAGVGGEPLPLHVQVRLDGEWVESAAVKPGLAHSGFEKLAEHLGYHQLPLATERVTAADPAAGALAAALAVESLLRVEVPPRARCIRLALAELSRLRSHLEWLGRAARAAGFDAAAAAAARAAEAAADVHQLWTTRRRLAGTLRVGGLVADLPEGAAAAAQELARRLPAEVARLGALWLDTRSWTRRACGLAPLEASVAVAWGVTGPDLRACGVEDDTRRNAPYSGWADLELPAPETATATASGAGDVRDRCAARLAEIEQSGRVLATLCGDLPEGDVAVDDYKVRPPDQGGAWTHAEELMHHMALWMDGHGLRPEPGAQAYLPVEAATGELGLFLHSDGTGRPYRAHLRSPSLRQAQVLPQLLCGAHLEDVPLIVASLGICAAEMDR